MAKIRRTGLKEITSTSLEDDIHRDHYAHPKRKLKPTALETRLRGPKPDLTSSTCGLDGHDNAEDREEDRPGMSAKMTAAWLQMAKEERSVVEDQEQNADQGNLDDDSDEVAQLEMDDPTSVASAFPEFTQDLSGFELDPKEEAALQTFKPTDLSQSRTLADIIMAQIEQQKLQHEQHQQELPKPHIPPSSPPSPSTPSPSLYPTLGRLLSTYTSGPLPKAFKLLPQLPHWEPLLHATHPPDWSPHALYAATRLFASNLNSSSAQRFFNLFLLPAIISALASPKSEAKLALHPLRLQAIQKAMFKPQAFIAGFLIPFCATPEVSAAQAGIVAVALQRSSIPSIPVALGLVKLSQMKYSPVTAVMMKTLLGKRNKLPLQAVDTLVGFFCGFGKKEGDKGGRGGPGVLPVSWHQTLRLFVQVYGGELVAEQVPLLRGVAQRHFHAEVTPEIVAMLKGLEQGGGR